MEENTEQVISSVFPPLWIEPLYSHLSTQHCLIQFAHTQNIIKLLKEHIKNLKKKNCTIYNKDNIYTFTITSYLFIISKIVS